jgi:peptidoglycan LD-endopeptidase LytH
VSEHGCPNLPAAANRHVRPGIRRCVLFSLLVGVLDGRVDLVFPAPNQAWTTGRIEDFVQATASGDPESGLFGCVRSSGAQFHEGLDIRPTSRDRRGEATDVVVAAMDGIVRHTSRSPGNSSYGRYVVIEHPDLKPAVYTLYAHLASVDSSIQPGVAVGKGARLGVMGRSAGGYAIPKERAHLHFEIGLRASDSFQSWYVWKKFGSPNEHGNFNGMNLMGIDPLDFLRNWRAGRVDDFQQYFSRMETVVRVRVATTTVPDFIRRYPVLQTKAAEGLVAGWEIECNATGIPIRWTPLSHTEVDGMARNEVRVMEYDAAAARGCRCKQLVRVRGKGFVPGPDLQTMLQQVFGFRS